MPEFREILRIFKKSKSAPGLTKLIKNQNKNDIKFPSLLSTTITHLPNFEEKSIVLTPKEPFDHIVKDTFSFGLSKENQAVEDSLRTSFHASITKIVNDVLQKNNSKARLVKTPNFDQLILLMDKYPEILDMIFKDPDVQKFLTRDFKYCSQGIYTVVDEDGSAGTYALHDYRKDTNHLEFLLNNPDAYLQDFPNSSSLQRLKQMWYEVTSARSEKEFSTYGMPSALPTEVVHDENHNAVLYSHSKLMVNAQYNPGDYLKDPVNLQTGLWVKKILEESKAPVVALTLATYPPDGTLGHAYTIFLIRDGLTGDENQPHAKDGGDNPNAVTRVIIGNTNQADYKDTLKYYGMPFLNLIEQIDPNIFSQPLHQAINDFRKDNTKLPLSYISDLPKSMKVQFDNNYCMFLSRIISYILTLLATTYKGKIPEFVNGVLPESIANDAAKQNPSIFTKNYNEGKVSPDPTGAMMNAAQTARDLQVEMWKKAFENSKQLGNEGLVPTISLGQTTPTTQNIEKSIANSLSKIIKNCSDKFDKLNVTVQIQTSSTNPSTLSVSYDTAQFTKEENQEIQTMLNNIIHVNSRKHLSCARAANVIYESGNTGSNITKDENLIQLVQRNVFASTARELAEIADPKASAYFVKSYKHFISKQEQSLGAEHEGFSEEITNDDKTYTIRLSLDIKDQKSEITSPSAEQRHTNDESITSPSRQTSQKKPIAPAKFTDKETPPEPFTNPWHNNPDQPKSTVRVKS